MDKWNGHVLIPCQNTKVPSVVPLLILDLYLIHMMGNIMNRIQSFGIEVIRIPASCTYLCQLVDVGMNKSIEQE